MQKGQCKKEGKQGPSPPFEYIVYPTLWNQEDWSGCLNRLKKKVDSRGLLLYCILYKKVLINVQ